MKLKLNVNEDLMMIYDSTVIKEVISLIEGGLCIDGGHHKQWYLEEIAKALYVDLESIEHDEGIAP